MAFRFLRSLATLWIAYALVGCASIKPYSSSHPANTTVTTSAQSGSLLDRVQVELDIYLLRPDCSLEHLGRRTLRDATTELGLPSDVNLYLEFLFVKDSWIHSNQSVVSHDTTLRVRPMHRYSVDVRYSGSLYEITLREKSQSATSARVLERQGLDRCQPVEASKNKSRGRT